MPVLTDLEQRIQQPPFDAERYRNRLPAAQAAAERMPLLHVTGMYDHHTVLRLAQLQLRFTRRNLMAAVFASRDI